MPDGLPVAAVLLAATLALGLLPMIRTAIEAERMLAAQLLGTNGVALLLLLAFLFDLPALIDVGLVLALLAAVALIAFTRRRRGDRHA